MASAELLTSGACIRSMAHGAECPLVVTRMKGPLIIY